MPVTSTTDRLLDLYQLRLRVDREIADLERDQRRTAPPRTYRPRNVRPACGTEPGYQWHRHQGRSGRAEWPLPDDDPCGCRAAHREHRAIEDANRRAAARARRRAGLQVAS